MCGKCAQSILPDTTRQCGSTRCINYSTQSNHSSNNNHDAVDHRCLSMIDYKKFSFANLWKKVLFPITSTSPKNFNNVCIKSVHIYNKPMSSRSLLHHFYHHVQMHEIIRLLHHLPQHLTALLLFNYHLLPQTSKILY